MRLKVCGMTKIDQLKELEALGIDFAGLIFYKPSPRYALNGGLSPSKIKTERVKINKIGVFVNESVENILKIVDDWQFAGRFNLFIYIRLRYIKSQFKYFRE
jgi:phosphoribosylanthranilate isomerase